MATGEGMVDDLIDLNALADLFRRVKQRMAKGLLYFSTGTNFSQGGCWYNGEMTICDEQGDTVSFPGACLPLGNELIWEATGRPQDQTLQLNFFEAR